MSTRRIEESKIKQQEELNCNTKKKMKLSKPVRKSIRIANLIKSREDNYESTKKVKRSIAEIKHEKILNNEIANVTQSMGDNLDENIVESGSEIITINNQLHHYCLVKIFSYLPVLDRLEIKKVCKKWEEAVAISWSNVKKIDIDNLQILIQKRESTLKELLNNCCKYLTHLTIDYQCLWMADALKNNCKNIINFDVKLKLAEYFPSLCEIIESMTKLKILKIKGPAALDIPHLWNELIGILPADIEEIHLSKVKIYYSSFNYTECCLVLDKFINLRCLTLRNFPLTPATIESILLNKNSLIYLDLYGCNFPKECPQIFTKLVNLEHLNLNGVKNFNYNIITEIAHNCHKLKYLCVNRYSSSIHRSIFSELKYLNNLEHLNLPPVEKSDDVNDNLMSDFFDNCKKLKYLNVGEGENFSTLDIEAITKLNNLQYLNLYMARVDSQSFINIANNCLELKELIIDLYGLPAIALEKLTNLKKLEKFELAGCYNLTGNLLSKIVDNCKNLVDLDIRGCNNVTEDSLIQVGKLDNIKILNISGIENVPIEMFDYFRKLEELRCMDCPSVTDEGIKKVIDNCFNLSYLNVKETGITVDSLVHAANRKISFKILNIFVNESVQDDYISLNGKPSRYLKINFR